MEFWLKGLSLDATKKKIMGNDLKHFNPSSLKVRQKKFHEIVYIADGDFKYISAYR